METTVPIPAPSLERLRQLALQVQVANQRFNEAAITIAEAMGVDKDARPTVNLRDGVFNLKAEEPAKEPEQVSP